MEERRPPMQTGPNRRQAIVLTAGIATSLALTLTPTTATASDPLWLLEGAWLVSVGDGQRNRFLQLEGLRQANQRITAERTLYGFFDHKGAALTEWHADVAQDVITMRFLTQAGSEVHVVIPTGEGIASGEIRISSGKRFPIRLTKITQSELAQLRDAHHIGKRLAKIGFTPATRIELLYVGAPDCPFCRGYQAEYFGRKNLMQEKLPEFQDIVYTEAHLGSYRARNIGGVLPAHLAALAQPSVDGKEPTLMKRGGVPFFAVIIDNTVIVQGTGVPYFESRLIPLLREAVGLRRQTS